jgi:hypothetical protein
LAYGRVHDQGERRVRQNLQEYLIWCVQDVNNAIRNEARKVLAREDECQPFFFGEGLSVADVEISDEVFIIKTFLP